MMIVNLDIALYLHKMMCSCYRVLNVVNMAVMQ